MVLEKSLTYLCTQTASETKTSHTRTAKKPTNSPFLQVRSYFKYVICQGLLSSVWSVTPPPFSCSCCGDIGGPGVPALNPKTHTSCLSHCFPLLLQLSPLHSLFSASLFSRPFCSASFLFQTNSGNFLFYCRF